MAETTPPTVAAVDLGSNSFHVLVARLVDPDLHVLDRMREPVCLAAGLDADDRLTEEAQERALASLERIGQRLREMRPEHVRAVATNTLRRARNARAFLARAQQALGHRIEIISGQEEARLIYAGVAGSHSSEAERRLVVDVGGGSTEIILGEGSEVLLAHSLFMGCVEYTRQYFPGGELRREYFRRAELAAALELRSIRDRLRSVGWNGCVGTSGTVNAIHDALHAEGSGDDGITLAGMKRVRQAAIAAGDVAALAWPSVREDRVRVLPGGLSILMGVFKSLKIQSMSPSPRALREGVIYDLCGRILHEDARDRAILRLVRQYHVDEEQAARVERTVRELLGQVAAGWSLDTPAASGNLVWAARLHEVGLAVAYSGYHRHGEYLVAHTDMPGFSTDDQRLVAALVRGHRRKLTRSAFANLPVDDSTAIRLCVLLRLAVLLNRGRAASSPVSPEIEVEGEGESQTVRLRFPSGWLVRHPLTAADLEREVSLLAPVGVNLRIEAAVDAPLRRR